MEYFILGIDTSNYTTSMALVDQRRNIILDNRKILNVKEGQKGLRQSEALFQHLLNMPLIFDEIPSQAKNNIKYVSVSNRPRPRDDSYMPVFLASKSFGQVISSTLNCQYIEFSHQENHIEAAKWSSGYIDDDQQFIGVHLSGGTTEILLIRKLNREYSIDIVGGSLDISAGQLLDRLGVKLGYKFPCGAILDKISIESDSYLSLPISVKDTFFNFSGLETKAYQLIDKNMDHAEVVKSVLHSIAHTLGIALKNSCEKLGVNKILCFGGVASSKYLRSYLLNFSKENNFTIYFGQGKYCTDNAVGTAMLPLTFVEE